MAGTATFADRPQSKTLCLFDVDGTLSPARRVSHPTCSTPLVRNRTLFADRIARDPSSSPASPQEGCYRICWGFGSIQDQRAARCRWSSRRVLSFDSFTPSSLEPVDVVVENFDYGFAENGLTAYKAGKQLKSQSFINFLGEDKYKTLVNFILHYIADMDIPIKRYVPSYQPIIVFLMFLVCGQRYLCRVPQRHDQCQPHWSKCDVRRSASPE